MNALRQDTPSTSQRFVTVQQSRVPIVDSRGRGRPSDADYDPRNLVGLPGQCPDRVPGCSGNRIQGQDPCISTAPSQRLLSCPASSWELHKSAPGFLATGREAIAARKLWVRFLGSISLTFFKLGVFRQSLGYRFPRRAGQFNWGNWSWDIGSP